MFPTTPFDNTVGQLSHQPGDWFGPVGEAETNYYYEIYGFDTEAVYGPEPQAGPSTAISAVPTYPVSLSTVTYELPPPQMGPYVQPGYAVQDEWSVPPPGMVQPVYPPGWDAVPPTPHPLFHPEHADSDPQTGTNVPTPVDNPPPVHPSIPPSSGPKRTKRRGGTLSPAEVSTFKERLRDAQPPGGYKSETAIAATNNIVKDRLPATAIGLSSRPQFDEELYLEDALRQHLGARNKTDMYQKLWNRLESMTVVNPEPVLFGRSSGPQYNRNGETEAAEKKVEASIQRRRRERTVLELLSQRFELPVGKSQFRKIEVLNLALAHLVTNAGDEETEANSANNVTP